MSNQKSHLLAGKTVIVTGASAGIGRATALTMAKFGAAVVVHARRKEKLDELAKEITKLGGSVLVVAGDAGNPVDLNDLLEQTLNWKDGGRKYDIVVVNAGRGLAGGVLSSDSSQWQELYQVNVLGATHLLRQAGKYMVERKSGDLVVLGSVVGRNISPFSAFYGSSKFAIGAVTEALRQEVAAHGVRVSLVMPGIVISEFQKVAGYDENNFGKTVAQFGKPLVPDDIAESIGWLVSLPSHINVSEIMIRPTGQNYP